MLRRLWGNAAEVGMESKSEGGVEMTVEGEDIEGWTDGPKALPAVLPNPSLVANAIKGL